MMELIDLKNKKMLNDDILFSPFDCFFCVEPITIFKGLSSKAICTHHIDWNHDNDDPWNVAYAHHGCHSFYHFSIIHTSYHLSIKKQINLTKLQFQLDYKLIYETILAEELGATN